MGGARWWLAAALAVLGLAACATADRPGPPAVAATTTTAAGPDGIRDRTTAWVGRPPRRRPAAAGGQLHRPRPGRRPGRPVLGGLRPRGQLRAGPGGGAGPRLPLPHPPRPPAVLRRPGLRPDLGRAPAQLPGRAGGAGRPLRPPAPAGPGPAGPALAARRLAAGAWSSASPARRPRRLGADLRPRPQRRRHRRRRRRVPGDGDRRGRRRSARPGGAGRRTGWWPARSSAAAPPPSSAPTADQSMAVRWREGRRGLAVGATFPTTPSDREVAALQALLVRVARSLRVPGSGAQAPGGPGLGVGDLDAEGGQLLAEPVGGGEVAGRPGPARGRRSARPPRRAGSGRPRRPGRGRGSGRRRSRWRNGPPGAATRRPPARAARPGPPGCPGRPPPPARSAPRTRRTRGRAAGASRPSRPCATAAAPGSARPRRPRPR